MSVEQPLIAGIDFLKFFEKRGWVILDDFVGVIGIMIDETARVDTDMFLWNITHYFTWNINYILPGHENEHLGAVIRIIPYPDFRTLRKYFMNANVGGVGLPTGVLPAIVGKCDAQNVRHEMRAMISVFVVKFVPANTINTFSKIAVRWLQKAHGELPPMKSLKPTHLQYT